MGIKIHIERERERGFRAECDLLLFDIDVYFTVGVNVGIFPGGWLWFLFLAQVQYGP